MPRRTDIDLTRGFAILLVVFGHLVARADPAHVHWYEPLRRAVYAFHMPLFLYLSGWVALRSGTVLAPPGTWVLVAGARARRLLLPFLAMGGLIVLGKLLLRHVMMVDNPPVGLRAGLADLVWNTAHSPALSIWYLFVLFVVSLASMVWLNQRLGRLHWLLGAMLVLYALPLPAYAYADRIGAYAVFFGLGLAAGALGERWDAFMDRYWPSLLAALACCLVWVALFGAEWPQKYVLLPVGALSMPAIHGWLRYYAASWPRMILLWLGRYSFMIYLFNTLFIGFSKGILVYFWSWNGTNFLPFACALLASGVLGPVWLKRAVFRRVPVVDRLTD